MNGHGSAKYTVTAAQLDDEKETSGLPADFFLGVFFLAIFLGACCFYVAHRMRVMYTARLRAAFFMHDAPVAGIWDSESGEFMVVPLKEVGLTFFELIQPDGSSVIAKRCTMEEEGPL